MNDSVYPDYRGGSIVNLMNSIISAYGAKCEIYPVLKHISANQLRHSRNLVLLVLDGLGYNYLLRHGEGSILHQYLQHPITSVAPPTTATAITTSSPVWRRNNTDSPAGSPGSGNWAAYWPSCRSSRVAVTNRWAAQESAPKHCSVMCRCLIACR